MNPNNYYRAIEILRGIQELSGTKRNDKAVEASFENNREMLLSYHGHFTSDSIKQTEAKVRQDFNKYPLLTEYENVLMNWSFNEMLNILYDARGHISSNDFDLDFEMPIVGSVDFGYFDARAINDDGAKVILLSRALVTANVWLAPIIVQSLYNRMSNLPSERIHQHFTDTATSFYLFRDISGVAKHCSCDNELVCVAAESLIQTSILFTVAHEYAHLILGHPPSYFDSKKKSYIYEKEADELAGLLCGVVICGLTKLDEHQFGFSFTFEGLSFALKSLDLFNEIVYVRDDVKWNPDRNTHPLNRFSVLSRVMERLAFKDSSRRYLSFSLADEIRALWVENRGNVIHYINEYNNGVSYGKIQERIYRDTAL